MKNNIVDIKALEEMINNNKERIIQVQAAVTVYNKCNEQVSKNLDEITKLSKEIGTKTNTDEIVKIANKISELNIELSELKAEMEKALAVINGTSFTLDPDKIKKSDILDEKVEDKNENTEAVVNKAEETVVNNKSKVKVKKETRKEKNARIKAAIKSENANKALEEFSVSDLKAYCRSKKYKKCSSLSKEDLIDFLSISQSKDVEEVVKVIQKLNPKVEMKIDNHRIYTSKAINKLLLPAEFEYRLKGGINNNDEIMGSYVSFAVEPLEKEEKNTEEEVITASSSKKEEPKLSAEQQKLFDAFTDEQIARIIENNAEQKDDFVIVNMNGVNLTLGDFKNGKRINEPKMGAPKDEVKEEVNEVQAVKPEYNSQEEFLNSKTDAELQEICEKYNLDGYQNLGRAELISFIIDKSKSRNGHVFTAVTPTEKASEKPDFGGEYKGKPITNEQADMILEKMWDPETKTYRDLTAEEENEIFNTKEPEEKVAEEVKEETVVEAPKEEAPKINEVEERAKHIFNAVPNENANASIIKDGEPLFQNIDKYDDELNQMEAARIKIANSKQLEALGYEVKKTEKAKKHQVVRIDKVASEIGQKIFDKLKAGKAKIKSFGKKKAKEAPENVIENEVSGKSSDEYIINNIYLPLRKRDKEFADKYRGYILDDIEKGKITEDNFDKISLEEFAEAYDRVLASKMAM